MPPLLTDEDFDHRILRGLLRRRPQLDIVTIRDLGLSGAKDPGLLEQAAQLGRVLLTHDKNTISKYAYERVTSGKSMPGVIMVAKLAPIGLVIDDILLLLDASSDDEWADQVKHIPL